MDLSINRINLKNNIKFKGMKGALRPDNIPVYRFIAPPHKQNEKVELEVALLQEAKGGIYKKPLKEDFLSFEFEGDNPVELGQDNVKDLVNGFAYRYKITDPNTNKVRYLTDSFQKIKTEDGEEMNLVDQARLVYGITPKGGAMRHSFLDSDAILDANQQLKGYDKNFVRNHFNKLGGNISGLNYLLTKTNELDPYKYIITTPDIGADKISSHGYWPVNQYQCSDVENFKNFIFELYKRGKGYVADGAFTSQGFESPMVQHVLKWGEDSPFYNMLKVDGYLGLGVLPDRSPEENVGDYDNIGVRIVNNPKAEGYDKTKPSFIQFYDTRLTSNKLLNSKGLIGAYDIEISSKDDFEITTHQDSVLPYYFEIRPDDKTRLQAFKNSNHVELNELNEEGKLEDFLTFPYFKISKKSEASGANFWDGNRDIIKMNLSNPSADKANIKGFFDARNYLFGVSTYWSEMIQSDLILKTALMSPEEKEAVALNNDISEETYKEIRSNAYSNNVKSFVLEDNKTVEDYVQSFPLQSIETDPTLSAVFAEPDFNEVFLSKDTGKTIAEIVKTTINEALPEEFQLTKEQEDSMSPGGREEYLKEKQEYVTYVTKIYAPAIIKNVLMGAMCPKAIGEGGSTNLDILKDISLASLGANKESTVKEERDVVIGKLRRGIDPKNTEKIKARMKKELENISLSNFKLSESIVLQGKAGLNWRFDAAKDIGDMDAVRDKSTSFEYIWNGDSQTPGVVSFWSDFISRAKRYNPSAYIISEITQLWDFAKETNDMPEKCFDKNLQEYYKTLSEEEKQINENNLAPLKEALFLNASGSTTSSNYNSYFNNLSNFAGVDPEHGYDRASDAGNVKELKRKTEGFIGSVQADNALMSHMFVENHDKPRILHTLPLNGILYQAKTVEELPEFQKAATELTGRTDYKNISGKAVAVGLMLKEAIDTQYAQDPSKKELLLESLKNLVNGHKQGDSRTLGSEAKPINNFRRAVSFANRPYLEVVAKDMFNNAGYDDQTEIENFCYNMLKNSMNIQKNLWEVMNALEGTPTLYYGMEFAQTGYESSSKNATVANRSQTMRQLKDKNGYKEYYNEMQAITSLYQEAQLSAIRNGFPISLDIVSTKDGMDAWPIFKYDEKGSKTLSLITSNGLPKGKNAYETKDVKCSVRTLESIPLRNAKTGCPLEDGTILKKKVYRDGKFVDEDKEYIVQNGAIKAKDNSPIALDRTVVTFYVPKKINQDVINKSSLYNGIH